MEMSCPGRDSRKLDSMIVRCPECGAHVEIFTDEAKVRCRCGRAILREAIPSCIQWCPAAERCLGEVIDIREVRKRLGALQEKAGESDYVGKMRKRIEEAGKGENDSAGERCREE